MSLYLGCPIWSYQGWVGSFFPKGTKPARFLYEYARRLNTVEGNTTFYAVPSAKTLQRWAEETPESFRFCPKLPRAISHAGKLQERLEEAQRFCEAMGRIGERLGPMFLQLPPRYPPTLLEDLRLFLQAWSGDIPLAVEVRHPAWFEAPHQERLSELLGEYGMPRVTTDTRPIRSLQGHKILEGSVYQRLLEARQRKPDLPIAPEPGESFTFLRYIGFPQLEGNAPFIQEWADHLAGGLRQGKAAYVFCHCPDERLDPWLCRELHEQVAARTPLPPLPWEQIEAGGDRQGRLF